MKYRRIEGAKKLETFMKPMLAQLSDKPAFDSNDWIFEIKWDGYRAVSEIKGNQRKLYSRNGLTFNAAYPKVFEALKAIKNNVILDGEIVVTDIEGKPSFQKLQNYESNKSSPIFYYIFDCISVNGKDVSRVPLLERKEIVKSTIPESPIIKYCDHVEGQGKALFAEIKKLGLEGIIAKKASSIYLPGKRTKEWLKIKNINTMEAVIVGFTAPQGTRNYFGSLLLGIYQKNKLTYIGNVGTGFTQKRLKEIYELLKPLIQKVSPLDVAIKQTPDITWVAPVLVANINYTEITDEGNVRHPVFQEIRIDKSAHEVTAEE